MMYNFSIDDPRLARFVTESNLIEGIVRPPTDDELVATRDFLLFGEITVQNLSYLVNVYAPGHVLRDRIGLDVRVGSYLPPSGGPEIKEDLEVILMKVNQNLATPWRTHVRYEALHPFSDGNGRSGRALWAWHMRRTDLDPFALSFLHRFYYQTLASV